MPIAEAGKTLNGWLPKLATGLAITGIVAGVAAWGQQQGMAENVEANEKAVEVALDKAYNNETAIAVIGTKLEAFATQYDKDQKRAAGERAAILEAVNR